MIITVFTTHVYSIVLYFLSRGMNTVGSDLTFLIEVHPVVDIADHSFCTHIDHNNGKYVTLLSSKSH